MTPEPRLDSFERAVRKAVEASLHGDVVECPTIDCDGQLQVKLLGPAVAPTFEALASYLAGYLVECDMCGAGMITPP